MKEEGETHDVRRRVSFPRGDALYALAMIVATVAVSACREPPPPQSAPHAAHAPSSPGRPPTSSVAPAAAPPAAAPPAAPSTAIALEMRACRSSGPAYRVTIATDGAVAFTGEQNVAAMSGQAQVDPTAVRALADRMIASGIARLGHVGCKEVDGQRCGMHACWVALEVTADGVTFAASRTNDARPASPTFQTLVAEVEKLTELSKWTGKRPPR